MVRQRLILIHGRSVKPCQASFADLNRRALLDGLHRVDPAKAAKVKDGTVAVDHVYYGDITNAIMSDADPKKEALLTATDPANMNVKCLPPDEVYDALDQLRLFRRFDKDAYAQVLIEFKDFRYLDTLARAASWLADLAQTTVLNMASIQMSTPDMGAYLTEASTGQAIRARLRAPLVDALTRADDVCLISHSMGCMVAFDVFWSVSNADGEPDIPTDNQGVSRWITLGCPLGDAGIKESRCGADQPPLRRHPSGIVKAWHNVAAKDDFICHNATMADDFADMVRDGHVDAIHDHQIYNCYVDKNRSNPHKLFGYLVNPDVSRLVADWIQ